MSQNNNLNLLKDIISREHLIDQDKIQLNSNLITDLDFDDLDKIELLMILEENFDMILEEDQMETIEAIVNHMDQQC